MDDLDDFIDYNQHGQASLGSKIMECIIGHIFMGILCNNFTEKNNGWKHLLHAIQYLNLL